MRAKRRPRRLALAAKVKDSASDPPTTAVIRLVALAAIASIGMSPSALASEPDVRDLLERHCVECHNAEASEGDFNLSQTAWEWADSHLRQRWVQIHDRIENREMPPAEDDLPEAERAVLVSLLGAAIRKADLEAVRLFDELPIKSSQADNGLPVDVVSERPTEDTQRLLRRFVGLAVPQGVPDEAIAK